MTPEDIRAILLSFPGVEDGTSYGKPSFKAYGKFLTRLRAEDDSIVIPGVGFDEREMLIAAEPATFHLTPHYQNYPYVLARIETLDPGVLHGFIARRWRALAPKAAVKAWDADQGAPFPGG